MPVKRDVTPHTGHRVLYRFGLPNRLGDFAPPSPAPDIPDPILNPFRQVETTYHDKPHTNDFQPRVEDDNENSIPITYTSFSSPHFNLPLSTSPELPSTAFSSPQAASPESQELDLFGVPRATSPSHAIVAALASLPPGESPASPTTTAPEIPPLTFPIIFRIHFASDRLLSDSIICTIPFNCIASVHTGMSYNDLLSVLCSEFNNFDPELQRFCPQPYILLKEGDIQKLEIGWPKVRRVGGLWETRMDVGEMESWVIGEESEEDTLEVLRLLERVKGRVVLQVHANYRDLETSEQPQNVDPRDGGSDVNSNSDENKGTSSYEFVMVDSEGNEVMRWQVERRESSCVRSALDEGEDA